MGPFEIGLNVFVFYCYKLYESQEIECGGLDVIGPHKLIGNSTIKVWLCWRKCYCEVSAKAMLNVTQ